MPSQAVRSLGGLQRPSCRPGRYQAFAAVSRRYRSANRRQQRRLSGTCLHLAAQDHHKQRNSSRTVATGSVQHVVPFQAASRAGSKVEIGSLSRHPEQLFGSRRWPSHRAGNTNGMEHRRQRARFVKGNAPSIKEGYIREVTVHPKLLAIVSAGVLMMAGTAAWAQSSTAAWAKVERPKRRPGTSCKRLPRRRAPDREHPNMRPVTSSGSPSYNQHLNLRPVTELPRLQLVCARAKSPRQSPGRINSSHSLTFVPQIAR